MVNLMIIGAMKCGTTSLSQLLNMHSNISVAKNKEPHFFSQNTDWRSHISAYHSLYEPDKPIWCDASTTYTCLPEFLPAIWNDLYEYNPALQLIYIVRNPIDRLISNYMHMYERGYLDCSLEEAIRNETGVVNRGRYYTQMRPYYETFGSSQILILSFEMLISKPELILQKIGRFMSLDMGELEGKQIHANKSIGVSKRHHVNDDLEKRFHYRVMKNILPQVYNKVRSRHLDNSKRSFEKKPSLSKEMKEVLSAIYLPEMDAFNKLTGFDTSSWL